MGEKEQKLDFNSMFKKVDYRINYVPIDSRVRTSRWGDHRYTSGVVKDFTLEEIEEIIRCGDIISLRELSRYYYRTNGRYRNSIDFLATLPLNDTIVTPI